MKCADCGNSASWLDSSSETARAYCDEHVVQGPKVRLLGKSAYDWLEVANHDIVLVAPMMAGISTYYCDRCGAIVKVRGSEVILFHVAHANATSREDECYPGEPSRPDRDGLREKLLELTRLESARFAALDD